MGQNGEASKSAISPNPVESYETRASIFNRLNSTQIGDRELAWSEFRDRYAPIIAGFARRCGASNQDIDDIVQDVMTNFYSVSGGFTYDPAKGRFRGWLKTCTVRAALRLAGKNLRFRGMRLDEVPEVELAVEPLWVDIWEQQIIALALNQLRRQAGDTLAFRAFEQYVLLDRPAEVVAKELNTSVGNVHQAKTRMTKLLRDLVGHIREDDE